MELATPVNERAVIGGNNPPTDKRTMMTDLISDAIAAASAWVNEIGAIDSQANADRAADFKRQLRDLQKRADAARKEEKAPLDEEIKAIQEFWNPKIQSASRAEQMIDGKIGDWLRREEERIAAEREAARKAAEEAERAAQREMDRANELMAKAERGELAGTGINTMAQLEHAEVAREAAALAARKAKEAEEAKAGAGGKNTIGGVKRTVSTRTQTVVVLDLPDLTGAPPARARKMVAVALQKLIPFLMENGKEAEVREELGRLVNAVYRERKLCAPGCKLHEIKKVV
jgi:hypothetical protein